MHPSRMGPAFAIVAVCIGMALTAIVRVSMVRMRPAFVPRPAGATLELPDRAATGILTVLSGDVLHETRESSAFQTATPGAMLRQGEAVATTRGSALLSFGDTLTRLDDASEVVFVGLVPPDYVVLQKSGTVTYSPSGSRTISVRALHTLSVVYDGQASIEIRGDLVTVRTFLGRARVGFVDTDNETITRDLSPGETVLIDDTNRTVITR